MAEFYLHNIDSEDIEDVLIKVEDSFEFRFEDNEMKHVKTFGQLCDHIANKFSQESAEDCTTQQAFYKLRKAIIETVHVDRNSITADTSLVDILPRNNRISVVKKLEENLVFKLSILSPPSFIIGFLLAMLIVSLITLFVVLPLGAIGLAISFAGFWLAKRTGKELKLKTVGEVAKKMTRENYLKSRRNPKTYNRKEIEKVLIDLFSENLGLDKSVLTREANLY
jgi:hypothetical protein